MSVSDWTNLSIGVVAILALAYALIEKNKTKEGSSKSNPVIELTPQELSNVISTAVRSGVKEFAQPLNAALANNTAALRAVELTLTRQESKLEQMLHMDRGGDGS